MFANFKRESLRKLRMAEDKSPKGSIDEPIVDLIRLINDHPNYVTSSSCSGRIAVFCGVPATATTIAPATASGGDADAESANLITKGGKWLLAEHATITTEQLLHALRTPDALATTNSNMLIFKHEPFIMHVVCRDVDAAKALLQWGLACGFRESGVVLGNKKVVCAIRTTANGLEIPIARTASDLLVPESYIDWIVQVANDKFAANKRKTDQLLAAFRTTFDSPVVLRPRTVASVTLGAVCERACDTVKRVGHTAVSLGEHIVVFGGHGATAAGTTTRLAALQIVAVAADGTLDVVFDEGATAAAATEAPSARMHHSAVVVGGDMVVFGGRAGPARALNDVYAYNVVAKTWTHVATVGEPPAPRYKHTACVIGSTMFVHGGRDATTVFSDLFALNLAQSTPVWRRLDSPLSTPRFDHVSAVVQQTKLLFFGGMRSLTGFTESDDNDDDSTDCVLYDTVAKTWTRQAIGNADAGPDTDVIAASACSVDGHRVVVAGGTTPATLANGATATQQLYVLNGDTLEWQRLGAVEHANAAFVSSAIVWMAHTSSVYVLGGGVQCYGFAQVFSSSFQCELVVKTTAAAPIATDSVSSSATAKHVATASGSHNSSDVTSSTVDAGPPRGVLVSKLDVKRIKTLLETHGVYDKARRVHVVQDTSGSKGSMFLVPINAQAFDAAAAGATELRALEVVADDDAYANKFGRYSGLNRNDVIQSTIVRLGAQHGVSAAALARVPATYEFVGDVLLVPRDAFTEPEWTQRPGLGERLWAAVCAATTPRFTRVARKAFVDTSEKRQSRIELLYVDTVALSTAKSPSKSLGWVEVRENGIVYGWDLTRVMFSSGNVTEKARMGRIGCTGDVIVDLFCGIGYYVLPFLVHGGAAFVHACEWNPDSVAALRHNLKRNGVADRCQVHEGDNRKTAPLLADVADRVNLGLLPTSVKAWPLAVQVLKPQGGWLHVHDNVAVEDRDAWELRVVATLQDLAQQIGKHWTITCAHVERVKSYAPKVHHLVADIRCEPIQDVTASE